MKPSFNPQLQTKTIGQKLIYFQEIDSSNTYLLNNYEGDIIDGLVVIADHQTAGRGRHKRQWQSNPDQSLLFSILLAPDCDPKTYYQITLVSALAVSQVLEQVCGLTPKIKWPNDIYLNNKKCCGILCETKTYPDKKSGKEKLAVVAGMGLNLNQSIEDFSDDIKAIATSVSIESDKKWAREQVFAQIMRQFESLYDSWKSGHLTEILEEIAMRFYLKDRQVEIESSDKIIKGRVIGLSSQGFLLVQDAEDNVHTIVSGDIHAFSH